MGAAGGRGPVTEAGSASPAPAGGVVSDVRPVGRTRWRPGEGGSREFIEGGGVFLERPFSSGDDGRAVGGWDPRGELADADRHESGEQSSDHSPAGSAPVGLSSHTGYSAPGAGRIGRRP